MEYPHMETPFELVSFKNMNRKQAEQYFIWYMLEKEKRIRQLEQYINQDSKRTVLDKSPDSLIPLWAWFEDKIEWEKRSAEEVEKELLVKRKRIRNNLMQDTKQITALTMALAEDIAIYFSDTIISNNPTVHWGYRMKPKKLDGVNQPIMLGFKGDICVNPRGLVELCILRSSRKINREELYETYMILQKSILNMERR